MENADPAMAANYKSNTHLSQSILIVLSRISFQVGKKCDFDLTKIF